MSDENHVRQPAHIMVINDTQEILDLFKEILEGEGGYTVSVTSYGIRDIAEVRKLNPDLIIVDFMFTQENIGMQFVQKVRMTRDLQVIPIIICTAALHKIREQEGYLYDQKIRVVFKPFSIDHLLETVQTTLQSTPTAIP